MLVFVCSPLRGERPYTTAKYNRNLRRAAEYSRRVAAEGHIPITPHLYFSNFMDDQKPEDRKRVQEMGQELLRLCDEVWVFDENGTSEGMRAEIEQASRDGKPIRYK